MIGSILTTVILIFVAWINTRTMISLKTFSPQEKQVAISVFWGLALLSAVASGMKIENTRQRGEEKPVAQALGN